MKFPRSLTTLAAVGGLAMLSLVTGGTASAGSYTAGSWSLQAPSTVRAEAQVQQPINADGGSVFNHRSSTIPVKFKVTQTRTFAFESVVQGDSGHTRVPYPEPEFTDFSVLSYTMPSGVTVADITNLTADFAWTYGHNHGGGLRWQVVTPGDKNIMVDYGDASTTMQTGNGGTGVNMVDSPLADENRVESNQVGGTMYTPWSYVVANFGDLPVTRVDLVIDAGWGGDQILALADATVGYTGGSSTFTMPEGVTTTSNSAPAWVYLSELTGATPGPVDESTIFSTQGDTGGQFRQVDGMYMYNLPVAQLRDKTATYEVGISFNADGTDPADSPVAFSLR